ncbi:MAG: type VI secretion system baseplate subunit TssF [Gammaproteobacteria bacterium]|nr:MAG: type VI secretion system baseplate subunit TssF [Gammaproteobacteria bacterium]
MSLRAYFDVEMRRLHEAAEEFARLHPEAARMLNMTELRDRDPYVERLLEGVAFLTAQVRQQIDEDVPELSETLLNQMWPDLLRPLPAMTIMQLAPLPGQLRRTETLEAGLVFHPQGRSAEAPDCAFRTSRPLRVNPLRITQGELAEQAGGGSRLLLRFESDAQVALDTLDLSALSLYLHAAPDVALWLHQRLTRGLRGAALRIRDADGIERALPNAVLEFRAAHLEGDASVVPLSGRRFGAFHLLQEYFCFRERFMFVTLHGLEGVAWPERCTEFDLLLDLDETPPARHGISGDSLRLHCVPAVNLVEDDARPIQVRPHRTEWRVLPDAHPPTRQFVHSVLAVEGLPTGSGQRISYQPLSGLRHGRPEGAWYGVRRRDTGDEAPGVFLELGGTETLREQTLSCRILRFNGSAPHEMLGSGEITRPAPGVPSFVAAENLLRPTRPLYPPAAGGRRWHFLSHMKFSLSGLDGVEALQGLMALYDWGDTATARQRREAMLALEQQPMERVMRGTFLRGVQVRLKLDQSGFRSEDEIGLFGEVLHSFLGQLAPINLAVETRLQLEPSGRELTWRPMQGQRLPM